MLALDACVTDGYVPGSTRVAAALEGPFEMSSCGEI